MKNMWIGVYRSTIEDFDQYDDNNLAEVLVAEEFVKQYFEECQKEYYDTLEDFLNEYIADDTENFYEYAMKHNAVIEWKVW